MAYRPFQCFRWWRCFFVQYLWRVKRKKNCWWYSTSMQCFESAGPHSGSIFVPWTCGCVGCKRQNCSSCFYHRDTCCQAEVLHLSTNLFCWQWSADHSAVRQCRQWFRLLLVFFCINRKTRNTHLFNPFVKAVVSLVLSCYSAFFDGLIAECCIVFFEKTFDVVGRKSIGEQGSFWGP